MSGPQPRDPMRGRLDLQPERVKVERSEPLAPEQLARAAALQEARAVLTSRTAVSTTAPDAVDLVSVAQFILTGQDPWVRVAHEEEEASCPE